MANHRHRKLKQTESLFVENHETIFNRIDLNCDICCAPNEAVPKVMLASSNVVVCAVTMPLRKPVADI
jgi:hypothetical protein